MQEIEQLKRDGLSIKAINKLTGWDRKTIRKYLIKADAAPTYGPREPRPSKLDGFKPYIEERLKAGGLERTCAAAGVARAWLCR